MLLDDGGMELNRINEGMSWLSHWFFWAVVSFLVLLFVGHLFSEIGYYPQTLYEDIEQAGQFGDSYGYVNALFSALAFAGVTIALLMQISELRLQREEMRLQREATSEASEAQQDIAVLTAETSRAQVKIAEINEQTARTQNELAQLSFVSSYVTSLMALSESSRTNYSPEQLDLLREMIKLNENKFRSTIYVLSDNESLLKEVAQLLNQLQLHLENCVSAVPTEVLDRSFARGVATKGLLCLQAILIHSNNTAEASRYSPKQVIEAMKSVQQLLTMTENTQANEMQVAVTEAKKHCLGL